MSHTDLSRREALRLAMSVGVTAALAPLVSCAPRRAAHVSAADAAAPASQGRALIQRKIPSSGEMLPVVGIGTARRYDVGTTAELRAPLRDVLRRFPELGGRVVDTAPSYGAAESVVGDLVAELGNRKQLFLATKVNVRGGDAAAALESLNASMQRLHTDRLDLMQVHNLSGVEQLLPVLRDWKAAGRIRYTGVTTGSERQHDALEAVMKSQPMDFIQVDYAIDGREAAARILPLAADRGIAVLVNLPFGRTTVFQKVQGRPLPNWAKEIDCTSWAQLFLKYIVSHPSVTCVIPGTARPEYLTDNIAAARGRLPDAAMRKRIEAYFDAV